MAKDKGLDPKAVKEVEEYNKRAAEAMRKARTEAADLNKIAEELGSTWKDFSYALEDSSKSFNSLKYAGKDVQKNFETISDAAKTIYKSLEDVGDTMFEQVDLAKDLRDIKKQIANAEKKGWKNQAAALKNQQDHLKALQASAKMVARANDIAISKGINIKDITEEMMSPFEHVMDLVDKVPGGGMLRKFFGLDGMLEKVQKQVMSTFVSSLAETGSVGKSAFKALISGARGLLAAVGPILVPLIAIGATLALFKKALHLDQEITDMARGFGVSKEEAEEAHHHLLNIAMTTKVIGANAEELGKAYADLAKQTGISTIHNEEMLQSQVLLTKQYGMAGDEAAAFQMTAVGNNATTEQLMGTVSQMTGEYNKLTGNALNHKEIAKDIAKVSKTISAAYKGDIKSLAKAALQAKSMGMSLEQTASVAEKLLDVESSIEAEMKANVLTGKHMNMNAARQLAFQGDSAGAAAEALKQAGSYDDFLKMNVVQQKAVAEAAGMTVEELVNAGQVQKINEQLTGKQIKSLSELSEEERNRLVASGDISAEEAKKLALQEQQASTQEKMASIMDRINAAFDVMASVFSPIVDMMGWFVENWDYVYPIILGAGTALAVTMLPTIASLVVSAGAWAVEMAAAAIAAISSASAATLGLGIAGIAAGIAVGAAALSSATKATKVDDAMIDPDGGLVVKGKKGTFQLNEGDSIVAGTELGGSSDGGAGGEGKANGDQLASIKQLSKDVKGIDWKDLLELEFKFMMISDAFEELDVDQITKFSELAGKDLVGAGEKLAAGVNGLIGFDKNVSWMSLWSLEDSFDAIEDVFAELDVDALSKFASLADADMAKAGENLANGVNGLIGWDKNVKWSELWSLEESFDLIEDIFDELDTEALTQFGSLADKDLGSLAESLAAMFNTFGEFGTDETLKALDVAEDVFDYLEDALDELDYEQLGEFASADFSKMEENAKHLFAGINELSKLGSLDLNGLENTFDLLEDAMDELDMDELAEFLELDTSKLANIVNSALGGGGEGGAAAGKDPNAKVVSLLEQLIAKVDQPVNIKLGSRTIEEIGTQIGLRKSYSTRVDSGYGNV